MMLSTPCAAITPSTRFSSPASPMNKRDALGHESGKAGGEVVDHDDAFAGFRQRMNHVTSDIAGAAGDKHGHDLTRFPVIGADASGDAVKRGFRRKRTGHYA